MNLLENISLKPYNTFGVDVKARYFAEVFSIDDILQIIDNESFKLNQKLILGEGSDILFTRDFDGIIIKDYLKGIELMHENKDFVWLKVASGENWHSLVEYCVNNNWGGLENLALIPGTTGASPVQNIGAYGAEVKDCLHSLEYLDLTNAKLKIMMNEECKFAYRRSIFKENNFRNNKFITSVSFQLAKNPKVNFAYQDVKNEIKTNHPDIKEVFDAVVAIRKRKLPDPAVIGNAGSFFKNPVVSKDRYEKLLLSFPELKGYESDYCVKLAAAQLIDLCGWKNKRENNTGVHQSQALVIVNYGNASGQDIFQFSQKIQQSVYEKFGVELIPEVNIL